MILWKVFFAGWHCGGLCFAGCPITQKANGSPGYSAAGPFEEEWHGARLYRCKEVPRRGNTSVNIFLNYVSWPWYAAHALHRLPGGYDAVFCFNTSPVLMCWPAIRYAKKHHIPLPTMCWISGPKTCTAC